jgi:hypothetical protein
MADRSRMTGDCHVRICGRLRGRFPRPTRLENIGPAVKTFTLSCYLQNRPNSRNKDKYLKSIPENRHYIADCRMKYIAMFRVVTLPVDRGISTVLRD